MKYILSISLVLALGFVGNTHAQPISCRPVVRGYNYDSCCRTYYQVNKVACDAVDGGYYTPNVPGTVTGGTTLSTTAVNNTNPTAIPIVATPQTGSSELASCSKIKFLSLLDILIWVKCIIVVAIIPLIFTAALAFFLWGVMKFIAASDSTKKKEGKNFMIAGLIGLFVMTSLWGLINIVSNTLGTGSVVPVLQTSSLKKK